MKKMFIFVIILGCLLNTEIVNASEQNSIKNDTIFHELYSSDQEIGDTSLKVGGYPCSSS